MNDAGLRRTWRVTIFAALITALPAAVLAQSTVPLDSSVDAFVTEYRQAVSSYTSTLDFAVAPEPARPLSPAATGAHPPYSLDDLLGLAATGNPALRANGAAEDAARADLTSARARRLPTIGTETTGTYIGNPSDPIAIPANAFAPDMPVAPITLYDSSGNSLYDFKLTGDLPLFSWGKISLGIDLARTGLAAAALQRQKAERELAVRLRASWDALAYICKAGDVLDLQARIGQRLVELARQSAAAGFITAVDLANARIKLKEIEMAQTKLRERRDRLLSDLASMAGLGSLTVQDVSIVAPISGAPRWTEEQLWELAITGSDDLALASAQLTVKQGQKRLAEKEALGLPDIGLHVELSYGGPLLPFAQDDWRTEDDYQLTFSLGASGSILGNGVKLAQNVRAKAELARAEAQYADAERSLRTYIHDTMLGIALGKAQLEYAALKQEGWTADLEQRSEALKAGAGSETEYLGLMIEALGGLAEAYGTLADYRSALLSLDLVSGSAP
ncbi:MAG TPA: TolC family protein [bacterium]|nr:TolC family protein [bacterium]